MIVIGMGKEEIEYQIKRRERDRKDYEWQISNCNTLITELEEAREGIRQQVSNNENGINGTLQVIAERVGKQRQNNKFVKWYQEETRGVLNGTNTANGFSLYEERKRNISGKIQYYEDEIERYRNKIIEADEDLTKLRSELKALDGGKI